MGQKKALVLLIILAIIATVTSIYLVDTHYSVLNGNAVCDFDSKVSCSVVNTSHFSEFHKVPVSFFGVVWAIVLGFLALNAIKTSKAYAALTLWSLFGVIASLYFIWAEWKLGVICLFCTVVHIISFIAFATSLCLLSKSNWKMKVKDFIKHGLLWYAVAVVTIVVTFAYYNI